MLGLTGVSLLLTRNNILKQVWLSSSTTSTLQELLMIAQETRDRLMVVDEPLMTERSLPIEHLPLVLGLDAHGLKTARCPNIAHASPAVA